MRRALALIVAFAALAVAAAGFHAQWRALQLARALHDPAATQSLQPELALAVHSAHRGGDHRWLAAEIEQRQHVAMQRFAISGLCLAAMLGLILMQLRAKAQPAAEPDAALNRTRLSETLAVACSGIDSVRDDVNDLLTYIAHLDEFATHVTQDREGQAARALRKARKFKASIGNEANEALEIVESVASAIRELQASLADAGPPTD